MPTNYPDLSNLTIKELLSLTLRENPNSPVINELTVRFTTMREISSATVTELIIE